MKSFALFLLLSILLGIGDGIAANESTNNAGDKTVIIDIPTDLPPPASAEEAMPNHPFFAAPSTANEAMEKVQELEERIEKLEKTVSSLEEAKD